MRFDRRRSSSYRGLHLNDKILVGVEVTTQYLGSGKISQTGGTDYEIARVIYDIHCLYAEGQNDLKKAREVVVFIDSQRIDISSQKEDQVLVNFPLTQVKDVTLCLNEGPYSRTIVLVARGNFLSEYKAYVFYCKTDELAHEFYELATLAFQLGFKLLEKFYRLGESTSNGQSVRPKRSLKRGGRKRSLHDDDDSDGSDDVFCEGGKSDQLAEYGCVIESRQASSGERTVTISLQYENPPISLQYENPSVSRRAKKASLARRNSSFIDTRLKGRRRSEVERDGWFGRSFQWIRKYFSHEGLSSEVSDNDLEMAS